MATKKQHNALIDHLAALRPDHEKVLRVMERDEDVPNLYHISKDGKIKKFIPFVTRRSIQEEDRSIPRVCVSENLWDCFAGYAAVVEDFHDTPDGFLGGYYVYALPFDLAVKPKSSILPDVNETNERWIVGFDESHLQIEPDIIGKVFVRQISNVRNGKRLNRQLTLYIEVYEKDLPMRLNENVALDAGHYKVVVDGVVDRKAWAISSDMVSVSIIDKLEYDSIKKQVASLLSFDSVPASMKW